MDELDVIKALRRWQATKISKYREILERENIFPLE